MPVINGGGGHQFSHPSATRENLQRASTVNVAPSTSFKRHFADHTAFIDASCCSNNLNRTHSIHICVLTGSDHYKDCTRKHLPSRLRNSMRRKLSLLQGLCKKSSQAEDQAKPCKPRQNTRSGGINAWLDRKCQFVAIVKIPYTLFDPELHVPSLRQYHTTAVACLLPCSSSCLRTDRPHWN